MGHKRVKITDEMVEQIVAWHKERVPRKEMARRLGIRSIRVRETLRAQGFKLHAERNRLDKDQEQEVCRRYEAGEQMRPLAEEYGCDRMTVTNILKRRGIAIRQRTGPEPKPFSAQEMEAIRRMAAEGISPYVMSQRLHRSHMRIRQYIAEAHIPPPPGRVKGARHAQWRGGRQPTADGYVRLFVPDDDPLRVMATRDGYALEHRLVMAQAIGRPLLRNETVHHIDGNRSNNALSNLQLRIGRHGTGQVYRCCDCGSYNVKAVDLGTTEAVQ